MTQTIDQTLAERGQRYGEFSGHAAITQGIKEAMRCGDNWDHLADDMRECLEMVAHKIGRILNGDPDYIDSWTDIIGYTRLVEKRLIDEQAKVKDGVPEMSDSGGLRAFLESLMKDAAELTGVPEFADDCNDPTCVEHNPELAKAVEVLRRAGVLREV